MPKIITVTEGDLIEWAGKGLPVGAYPEHGIVLYPDEQYEVGSEIGADFANRLIEDGYCRKIVKKPAPVADAPAIVPAGVAKPDAPAKEAAKPTAS